MEYDVIIHWLLTLILLLIAKIIYLYSEKKEG